MKKDTNKSFNDTECPTAELVTLFGDFTVACIQTPLKRINALVVGQAYLLYPPVSSHLRFCDQQ